MLVNIIVFFLLLILIVLISININMLGQNKKKWKGGVRGGVDPNALLKILKQRHIENEYNYRAYPVFLKRYYKPIIDIHKIVNLLITMDRPNSYAIIDGRELIIPSATKYDIYSIKLAWRDMPITAISSKSFVIYDNKLINIYYIGSVYIMDTFDEQYYIDMITLVLLEANRIAHIEKKNAYIILEPLFEETGKIVNCYYEAISRSICDKIDSVHVYFRQRQQLPTSITNTSRVIKNLAQKQIILKIENVPIPSDNVALLSNGAKPFQYSKTIVVRQYITDGIAQAGNLYWAALPLPIDKIPNKYVSELNAANNSLIAFCANGKINPNYKSNVYKKSVVFDDTNFIDSRLSYVTLQNIDNLEFMEDWQTLSDIFKILLDNELPNANIIEKIINYYISGGDFYTKTIPFYTQIYYNNIGNALSTICEYLEANKLDKLYGIFYMHFIGKKQQIEDILDTDYPQHKDKVLRLLLAAKLAIFDSKISEHRHNLINEYIKYINKIFKLFTKLIIFFKKWKNIIPLVKFLSYYFSVGGRSLEDIVSIFNKTDNEKLLLVMPFLILWGMWDLTYLLINIITSDDDNNIDIAIIAPIFKSLYKIYLFSFRVVLTDKLKKDASDKLKLLQKKQIDTYHAIFDKFTREANEDKIKEYIKDRYWQRKQKYKHGGNNINILQEQLKKDLELLTADKKQILDNIDANKKEFNNKFNEFKKIEYKKFRTEDEKLLILYTKRSEFDTLLQIYKEYKALMKQMLIYKQNEKDINDQFHKNANKVYQEIDKNNLLKEQELHKQKMEQQEIDRALKEKHSDIGVIEMLTTIQSAKKEAVYSANGATSNAYKDKLLTLFEWFVNVPNNSIVLIRNIGHMPLGANFIYFIPMIPEDKYLYNDKWYSVGDIIPIDALKNIPNGTYYYRGNELYFG
jgi:hypothetical protein